MDVKKLSFDKQFCQMILLGLDVESLNNEIIDLIKEKNIGGVVIYKNSYSSLEDMTSFINNLKKINENNTPLFISIDQENGRVNRLPKDVNRIYNALKQAKTNDLNIINKVNDITSEILEKVGINMNFAPVLDIVRENDVNNKGIGNRSYGHNVSDVVKYGIPFMKSLQKHNIVSVIKHFPGHGITKKDSHFLIPKINNIALMEKEDLQVFKEAIKLGTDAIMIGHLKVKGYGGMPASINANIINDYLLKKYNYNSLVVSDDLRMNYMSKLFGIETTIKNAIKAKENVIMIKYKKGDKKRIDSIISKLKNNEEIAKLVEESASKILEIKKKYKINNNVVKYSINLNRINDEITKINELIDNNQ